MGYLYRPKLKKRPGETEARESSLYWCKYYVNGRPVRESTGADKETEAKRFLREREGRVATGQAILPRVDRIRYEEIAQNLRQHYAATGARDVEEAGARLKHLDLFFTQRRVAAINQAEATDYTLKRQGEGAANGTINRELAVLGRMLKLAYENGKLLRLPVIRKLKENGPRQGFFEQAQYDAVRRHLSPDIQVATAIAYAFGWRTQSEVLTLERRHLDLAAGTLRLDPGTTKNDEGRVVYLTPELKGLLAAQLERVEALQRQTGRIVPYLFPHLRGRRRGERRRDFRKAWATACLKAELGDLTGEARAKRLEWLKANPKTGLLGALRHDFRRTAVRNLVNATVPERVAMTITGHKTRAVFDRYHIVSPGDLQEAARKLAGTFQGTLGAVQVDSRRVSSDHAKAAPVAQLDRALASEAKGQRFESSRAHHLIAFDADATVGGAVRLAEVGCRAVSSVGRAADS
jgi:integrase